MWIKTEKYQCMEGEPQLGYVYEPELMYEEYEIRDAVEQIIKDDGIDEVPLYITFIDDYTDEEIEIEVSEYIDLSEYKEEDNAD